MEANYLHATYYVLPNYLGIEIRKRNSHAFIDSRDHVLVVDDLTCGPIYRRHPVRKGSTGSDTPFL